MASPGLLFLLVVSSSLLPSTKSFTEKQLKEAGEKTLKGIAFVKDTIGPFLGLIQPQGALIAAIVNLALGSITNSVEDKELLNVIESEFKRLNSKLDEYQAQTKWNIWSAAVYQDIETKIKQDWDEFSTILTISDPDEKKRLTDKLITRYKNNYDYMYKLSEFLTSKENIFIENLGEMIKEKINCHEKEIQIYTFKINLLIFKGTVVSLFYYKHENLTSKVGDVANYAFKSASVMFDISKRCTLKIMESVKIDVQRVTENTKNTKKRQKLAHEVRLVLAESYGSYDWMVVAYKTWFSTFRFKKWNKHVLSGFTEVPDKDITVAVARQVRGQHTMADKVKRAIQRCVTQSVDCHKVGKVLEACKERVDEFPVTQTYSAVHAFIDRPHDSYDAKEAPEEIFNSSPDTSVPYFYKGVCKKHKVSPMINDGGQFIVLIKSDDDLKNIDPCSKKDCGGDQRGTCVPVKDAFVALCDCKQNYFGLKCENSLVDYKKELEKALQA